MGKVLNKYPRIRITLKHDLSRKIFEGVINFVIDVSIVVDLIRHRALILKKLYDDEVGFASMSFIGDMPFTFRDAIFGRHLLELTSCRLLHKRSACRKNILLVQLRVHY
ncbi:putative Transcriptional regulator, LysR [Legionella sainthelensi]|nr:putative Transcriptional regulator, LysR [Legionella sainthelensi]